MRENRPYGSEGGVGESRSRPLSRYGAALQTQDRKGTCFWRSRISAAAHRKVGFTRKSKTSDLRCAAPHPGHIYGFTFH